MITLDTIIRGILTSKGAEYLNNYYSDIMIHNPHPVYYKNNYKEDDEFKVPLYHLVRVFGNYKNKDYLKYLELCK